MVLAVIRGPEVIGAALLIVGLLLPADGDIYINNPRGSNNKLHEVSNNVRNNKRLFDSENNNAGGYQVGDNCQPVCSENNKYDASRPGAGQGIMQYFEGSVLYAEWTMQHGSGAEDSGPKSKADVIIQFMCGDWVRDGNTTDRVPLEPPDGESKVLVGLELSFELALITFKKLFGMHEPLEFYQRCKRRERNKGLFTADKNLNDKRGTSIHMSVHVSVHICTHVCTQVQRRRGRTLAAMTTTTTGTKCLY